MSTSVSVKVTGKRRLVITQEGREPITVEGDYNGGSGEGSFELPSEQCFIAFQEVAVDDGDERDPE